MFGIGMTVGAAGQLAGRGGGSNRARRGGLLLCHPATQRERGALAEGVAMSGVRRGSMGQISGRRGWLRGHLAGKLWVVTWRLDDLAPPDAGKTVANHGLATSASSASGGFESFFGNWDAPFSAPILWPERSKLWVGSAAIAVIEVLVAAFL